MNETQYLKPEEIVRSMHMALLEEIKKLEDAEKVIPIAKSRIKKASSLIKQICETWGIENPLQRNSVLIQTSVKPDGIEVIDGFPCRYECGLTFDSGQKRGSHEKNEHGGAKRSY